MYGSGAVVLRALLACNAAAKLYGLQRWFSCYFYVAATQYCYRTLVVSKFYWLIEFYSSYFALFLLFEFYYVFALTDVVMK